MRYAAGIASVGVFAFVIGTGTASAAGCGHGARHHGNPAVSQYVEKIPTACGSRGDRGAAAGSGSSALPVVVARQLNRSKQGKLLRNVASSGRFGAPASTPRSTDAASRITSRSAFGAGVSAVSSGSNRGLITLLVLMAAVALGVAGAAVYRRRPH